MYPSHVRQMSTAAPTHRPQDPLPHLPSGGAPPVLISSVASDSHTWNLVFLQLLIEELGHEVVNLGPCVPDELLVAECRDRRPGLVVISTVNGHGYQDGMRVIRELRACEELDGIPVVIGGKLGVAGSGQSQQAAELAWAGFDAVFPDDAEAVSSFAHYIQALPQQVAS
ncbi:cobalamin B12-binding domain-containing protein [Streptomyces sp. BV286]|uniref:cobalamin B12-binding domain-containing protein n=1 Tax=Streptomyces sp. BV286 TaxID=2849672 RepID=UPI0020C6264B|nr:cobalamin-dependent protein [Streptomyces sp. BV286]